MTPKWIVLDEDSNIVWKSSEEPNELVMHILKTVAPGAIFTAYYADFTINVTVNTK